MEMPAASPLQESYALMKMTAAVGGEYRQRLRVEFEGLWIFHLPGVVVRVQS
jgi:hypothetical protein